MAIKVLFRRFFYVLMSSLILCSGSVLAEAPKVYIDNNFGFYSPDRTACQNGAITTLAGSVNAEKIYNFLTSQGFQPFQAAGIMGNLQTESGFDPFNQQNGSPWPTDGWGLAQWTLGRRDKLRDKVIAQLGENFYKPTEEAAGLIGTPEEDKLLSLELGFLIDELNDRYKPVNDALRASTSVDEATDIFMIRFEGPHDQSEAAKEARRQLSRSILTQYGSGVSSNTGPAIATSSCGQTQTDGLGISADGFVFPQQTTQTNVKNNDPHWCYTSQTNCHHDYNAADIFAATGTPVVAARGGTVVAAHDFDNSIVGSRVTIKANPNEGGHLYYYAHMGDGTIKVHEGDVITAGTQIGNVGTNADAVGTPSHTHFDILPPNYSSRPNCSGPTCTGYPFINPQPLLIAAFAKLPQ